MSNMSNIISFKIKKVISELESIEAKDERLSIIINQLALISKDYTCYNDNQLTFLAGLTNDSYKINFRRS